MGDDVNISYVTIGGHVEMEKYRFLYLVVSLTIYLLILCFNSIVVYLIWAHPNLHEPMYIFIACLLINSILWSSTVYPKLLVDYLSKEQIMSYSVCLLQFHMFYSLGGSEFLLLAAMAYDRYVSICKPLQYATIMNKRTIINLLIFSWVMPAAQVAFSAGLSANKKLCSFIVKGVFCNNTVFKLQCALSQAQIILDIVILSNVAIAPMFYILFTYSRILIITYRSSKEVKKKAAQTCLPHLIVLINFSCLCAFDVIRVHIDADFPKTLRLMMTFLLIMYHPLFNPIMYGLKMKEISKHLKKLLFPAKRF